MPFGLVNAPFTFQRVMNKVCENFLYKFVIVYLDDIIIFSTTPEQHLEHLQLIFERIKNFGFKLNIEKCHIMKSRIKFLGYDIYDNQIHIPLDQIKKIENWKIPKTKKDIRQFIGFCTYFKNFFPRFSEKMLPIYKSLKSNAIEESVYISINNIKTEISNSLPLKFPDFHKPFILYTDASNFALGAVITQEYDGVDNPIFFYSRKFTQPEINYTTTEKECLAIVSAIKNWRHYLSNKFYLKTDHQSLVWLTKNKDISQRLIRWNLFLQEFDYKINYIKSKNNILANAASRYAFQLSDIQTKEYSEEDKKTIIGKAHEDCGHACKKVTYLCLINEYYWKNIFKDVSDHIDNCLTCIQYRTYQPRFQKFRINLKGPFNKVQIDTIGPFPKTYNNNKFILVSVDLATRWVEARAVKNKSAQTVAKFLVEDIILRHGPPEYIISDQGKEFSASVISNICKIFNSKKSYVSSYNPKSNGGVERLNQTLIHKLSKLCKNKWKEWDEFLPYAVYGVRISPRSSSESSPFELLYGYKPNMSYVEEDNVVSNSCVETNDMMFDRLSYVHKTLLNDEVCLREKEIMKLNKGRDIDDLEVGQIVLRRIPWSLRENKLDVYWEGPYNVVAKGYKGNYKISYADGNLFSVNRKDLQLLYDSTDKWNTPRGEESMLGNCANIVNN
ncbi:Retrovirus-related Pol polyprotein from transposon 17.6 [Dictyocoela muelleri]|nr:Retrovirus-related Pol polyprotein from transposon 17.6 [Dictyocoela muelleri]